MSSQGISTSGDGEDEDDDSSSSFPSTIEGELENFRHEWRKEISPSDADQGGNSSDSLLEDEGDIIFNKARDIFLRGVDCESRCEFYEAIQFYKRAIKLVPDIEFRTFDYSSKKAFPSSESNNQKSSHETKTVQETNAEDFDDLAMKFQDLKVGKWKICEPEIVENTTHINKLPLEILVHILKWLVSDELDVASLENAALVCRGFYMACRSDCMWQSVCKRTWGAAQTANLRPKCWRNFYINSPRVRLNGCYIARMTYYREGERGFQDEFYKAWHLVQYYRYMRFFSGGLVVTATSAEEPASVVKLFSNRYTPPPIQGALYGRYQVVNNKVVCLFIRKAETKAKAKSRLRKRRDSNAYFYDTPDQELRIEFQLKGKRNRRLEWVRYFIVFKYKDGKEQLSDMDVTNANQYSPLYFSPVSGYFSSSNAPLQ